MSSILSFGMASSKKEKHSANSRARRHSSTSHGKKKKKSKDGDTDSVSSSSTDSSITEAKCPLRFMLAGLLEPEGDETKQSGCPLRRVQLWHVIPLCLFAILNILLVIIALLGLACYRITLAVQSFMVNLTKSDLDSDPYEESFGGTDFRIITISGGTEKLI